jgi:hypothetical protein
LGEIRADITQDVPHPQKARKKIGHHVIHAKRVQRGGSHRKRAWSCEWIATCRRMRNFQFR